MVLEDPWILIDDYDGLEIMRSIERAMRVCYRSEGSITDDSYKRLLKMAIDSGHESVMEHEKISLTMRCSVGTYKDLTRHRIGTAWSIESTRWNNYSKNKFDGQLHLINPTPAYINDKNQVNIWLKMMDSAEHFYNLGAAAGMKPDQLRTMLPHATAADVRMTCNMREWRHILDLRTKRDVHPEIRQILIPLLLEFKETMPELFGDIAYDTRFPSKYYAKIKHTTEV